MCLRRCVQTSWRTTHMYTMRCARRRAYLLVYKPCMHMGMRRSVYLPAAVYMVSHGYGEVCVQPLVRKPCMHINVSSQAFLAAGVYFLCSGFPCIESCVSILTIAYRFRVMRYSCSRQHLPRLHMKDTISRPLSPGLAPSSPTGQARGLVPWSDLDAGVMKRLHEDGEIEATLMYK